MAREQFTPGKYPAFEDDVKYPVTLLQDSHCLNCGDAKTVLELVDGVCFDPCQYGAYLQKEKR